VYKLSRQPGRFYVTNPYRDLAVYERVLKYALEAAEELGLTEEDARRATERALWA